MRRVVWWVYSITDMSNFCDVREFSIAGDTQGNFWIGFLKELLHFNLIASLKGIYPPKGAGGDFCGGKNVNPR